MVERDYNEVAFALEPYSGYNSAIVQSQPIHPQCRSLCHKLVQCWVPCLSPFFLTGFIAFLNPIYILVYSFQFDHLTQ